MTILAVARYAVWVAALRIARPDLPEGKALRIVDKPCLHVGVRPHSDALGDAAVTIQVTTCW